MITVAIAIAMERNPGRAVIAASTICSRPTVRTRRIEAIVTSPHATWLALELALNRLDGRQAVIITNNTILLRPRPYIRGPWEHQYEAVANECLTRVQDTKSSIVQANTKDPRVKTPESDAVRWLSFEATTELRRWLGGAEARQ